MIQRSINVSKGEDERAKHQAEYDAIETKYHEHLESDIAEQYVQLP